jgi:hypothetical protein
MFSRLKDAIIPRDTSSSSASSNASEGSRGTAPHVNSEEGDLTVNVNFALEEGWAFEGIAPRKSVRLPKTGRNAKCP